MYHFQQTATKLAEAAWPEDRPGKELNDALIARLCEEVGEVAKALRRYERQRWGHPNETAGTQEAVAEELGDVLFLVARVADAAGANLDEVAAAVIAKIQRRLHESGR